MPKGPRGEQRPADAIGRAIMVAEIAGDRGDPALGHAREAAELR